MIKKNSKKQQDPKTVAPGIDEADAFGENATESEINRGDYTTVTKLVYDEYDRSKK